MSILSYIHRGDFKNILKIVQKYKPLPDIGALVYAATLSIAVHTRGAKKLRSVVNDLEDRWYQTGCSDFTVYDDPAYIVDIWTCWVAYSRKYLKALVNKSATEDGSVVDLIGPARVVVDLGCGFGFTTIGLKEIFPGAKVYGTNIESSYQYEVAKEITASSGTQIVPDISSCGSVDVVFASEYFEHFKNPVEHLREVVALASPKFMIIANGFNGIAIGHFTEYEMDGRKLDPRTQSREFNKALRFLGYVKIKTKIWNNRPALWKRVT